MVLFLLTPTFTIGDWIYVLQHVVVLGVALTRPNPTARDYSIASSTAVIVAYAYPYAQVICLRGSPGYVAWPEGGLALVIFAAGLSLVTLLTLGRLFGVRPAVRGLATSGPYRFVRHPTPKAAAKSRTRGCSNFPAVPAKKSTVAKSTVLARY